MRSQPLPHREYSIASLPADGSLQLLVRQMRHPDGRLGSGSGWLTEHAALGEHIDLRIRSNPSFHPPADARPMILVGNGTGIAGLRALLKARIAAGHARNWLLFGERTPRTTSTTATRSSAGSATGGSSSARPGVLARPAAIAATCSTCCRNSATRLREWLDAGAAVYVCGSLEGMAPGRGCGAARCRGLDALEAMAEEGRYRRDVY